MGGEVDERRKAATIFSERFSVVSVSTTNLYVNHLPGSVVKTFGEIIFP